MKYRIRGVGLASVIVLTVFNAALAFWRLSVHGPGFAGSDSYSRVASFILANGRFENSFRPPLYPLFLAGMMRLAGESWQAAAIFFQAAAGVLLGCIVVQTALKLGRTQLTGWLALGLYLSNLLFQFEVTAKRETVFFTLFLAVFLTAPIFVSGLRRRYFLMCVSGVAAFLLRPNAIALVPIFVLYFFSDRRRPDFSLRLGLETSLLALLLLAPWLKFVHDQSGKLPITTSTNSGQTLWKGNNPYLFAVWPRADIDLLEPEMSREIGVSDITTPAADNTLQAQAVSFILSHPGVTFRNAFIKATLFFSPLPIPFGNGRVIVQDGVATLSSYRYRSATVLTVSTIQSLIILFGWLSFLVAALFNTRTAVNVRQQALATVGLAFFLTCIHTVTYPESRYRWPLDVYLAIPAALYYGGFLENFLRRSSSRQTRPEILDNSLAV